MKLSNDKIKELNDKFLGKRIEIPHRHSQGLGSPKETVAGICTFIGYNSHFPNKGLQVTIDRMPIINVDYTQIKFIY